MPFTEVVRLLVTYMTTEEGFHLEVWMTQNIYITLKPTSALAKIHESSIPGTPYTMCRQLCQEKLLTTNV